jgi:hypothetical protein
MIQNILLEHVGPASRMNIDFAPRFNVITGDNGLGKTFLLDAIWWALSRSWAGEPLRPPVDSDVPAQISFLAAGRRMHSGAWEWGPTSMEAFSDTFNPRKRRWEHVSSRVPFAGLVVYARLDGGVSVWDPAKHVGGWSDGPSYNTGKRSSAYNLTNEELWNEKKIAGKPVCNGLIRDWVAWQLKQNAQFKSLQALLMDLSPHREEVIQIGQPMRMTVEDAREFPTIKLPYGEVPVTVASAGMRRVISIAYALVWAWHEHAMACDAMKAERTQQIVFLIDEVEAHLHPQWQRVLLPALKRVCTSLMKDSAANVQMIATTHAPLVLASVETLFDEQLDNLLVLEAHGPKVSIRKIPWAKQGDTVGWLVSKSFGLRQARSSEAENAVEAAEAFMRGDRESLPVGLVTRESIHEELRRTLPGHDSFWPRWIIKMEELK